MANHVHLIVMPKKNADLSKAIGEVHRRYTRMINFREKWRGYLWQGRFTSFPMQKAGLVKNAWDYQWSSVHAHLSGYDKNGLVEVNKVQAIFGDWKNYLLNAQGLPMEEIEAHNRIGRPLGNNRFLKEAGKITGRDLIKKKPGPKPKKTN